MNAPVCVRVCACVCVCACVRQSGALHRLSLACPDAGVSEPVVRWLPQRLELISLNDLIASAFVSEPVDREAPLVCVASGRLLSRGPARLFDACVCVCVFVCERNAVVDECLRWPSRARRQKRPKGLRLGSLTEATSSSRQAARAYLPGQERGPNSPSAASWAVERLTGKVV